MPEYRITSTTRRLVLAWAKRSCLLRGSVSAIVLAQMLLAPNGVAWAGDTWTGATNTDWFTGSNWASGGVPTTGLVTVSGTTPATAPVIDGQAAEADYFIIGSGNSTTLTGGSLTIQNGGQLNLTGAFGNTDTTSDFISGDNPVVTVTGQGSKLTTKPTGHIIVGSNNNGSGQGNGTLEILDGAEVNIGGITIGSNNSTASTLRVNGPGSSLTIGAGYGWLGMRATPNTIVEVSDGGKIVGPLGALTNVAMTATGAGSLVSVSYNNPSLLMNEQARLNVLDGAIFQLSGTVKFGFGGQTTIDGTGSAFNHQGTGGVQFGDGGIAGILIVSNGGAFQTVNTLQLGNFFGEVGILNIGTAPDATAVAPGSVTAGDGINVNAGSMINFNHAAPDYIFSSAVSSEAVNTGAINQISGTTILTADSSFTGVVTITGGILQFGNDTATGSLATNNIITGTDLTHKGTLAFGRSGTYTYDNTITGTGSVMSAGSGTTVLTADNSYSGGTVFSGGTLSVSADSKLGDLAGGLTFDGGILQVTGTTMNSTNRSIDWAAGGGGFDIADAGNTFTVSQNLGAGGPLTKHGAGTLVLSGTNTYKGGTTITAGTLQIGIGGTIGWIEGDVANAGALVFNRSDAVEFSGAISGTGSVTQNGTDTLTLSGNSSYSGGTNFNAGSISVEQEENLGSGALNFDGGTLRVTGTHFQSTDKVINWGANGGTFDIADANNVFALSNVFTGAGGLTKSGDGMLALSGDSSSFTGNTDINAGSLRLDGGKLGTGTVNVASGASLGGHGSIGGTTTVADGGNLFDQSGQRLDFLKDLTLNANSNVDVTLNGSPSNNELFHVAGNLTIGGTLTVNPNSNFGIGVYRIFKTDGNLTDNGMSMAPGSNSDYSLYKQAGNGGYVDLTNTGGRQFAYWDGKQTTSDGTVHGGDGYWNGVHTNTNWTGADGNGNLPWSDNQFAVFQGTGGTVTIDQGFTPVVSGMQFMVDGYTIEGSAITLGDPENRVIVGNGVQADSRTMTATIASVLEGHNGMMKSGYGTLNLTGANIYSGTTTVQEGTLELSGHGSIDNSPDIVLASTQFDHGDLLINKDQDFTLGNRVSGFGVVAKDGSGTTIFSGNNTFSGGLTVRGGTAQAGIADNAFGSGNVSVLAGAKLDLANFNETIGNLIGAASGDGDIDLGSGTLTLNQNLHDDFSGKITGSGGITKNGDGDLVFYGQNDYAGATSVNGGDLVQGAAGGFSAESAFAVASGASIKLGGFATNMAGLANGGDVYFGGTGGTVLNVSGDYVGNGGTLHMSAVLGDDNSLADRMNISGNTSGTSQIAITNRQGFGGKTSNGIEIISVGGSSDGAFTLNGDYKTKGGKQAIMTDSAYAYTLQKGGTNTPDDGNWYLVSQKEKSGPDPDPDCRDTNSCPTPPPGPDPDRFSAAAPVYESYAATLQALNKLPTLQQRVGERYLSRSNQTELGETGSKAIWGRIEGAHNRLENGSTAGVLHQDINTFIMQAGVDGQFYEDGNGRLIAGITGQYGKARSNVDNRTGDGWGTINTQGWGLGATATWYGATGFYVDAQAQANWYDSDLGVDAANSTLKNGNKGFGYALSLEAGQRFAIDQNWSLTPQAQLVWSSVDFDSFTDAYGARISNRNGDSLTARLGLAANYANSFTGSDGRMVNTSVYGIANLYQELMGDARMNYAGTHMVTDSDDTWGGFGAGGSYAWADNKYALYGEGSVNTSLNHFADSYALKSNLGFKVKW